jgi:hypothetical protein
MIVRAARPGHRARLAGVRAGVLALSVAGLAACAGSTPKVALPGSSASSSASTSTSPSSTGSGTPTSPPPSKTATPTPSHSPAPTPTPTPSHSPAPTPTPTSHSARPPAGAPATGGGGTAGFQDPLLAGLGGAALLAGAGSLAYRRKVLRNR